MVPTEIRVYPLSKIKEKSAFGTIEKAEEYFCNDLPFMQDRGVRPSFLTVFRYNVKNQ